MGIIPSFSFAEKRTFVRWGDYEQSVNVAAS